MANFVRYFRVPTFVSFVSAFNPEDNQEDIQEMLQEPDRLPNIRGDSDSTVHSSMASPRSAGSKASFYAHSPRETGKNPSPYFNRQIGCHCKDCDVVSYYSKSVNRIIDHRWHTYQR